MMIKKAARLMATIEVIFQRAKRNMDKVSRAWSLGPWGRPLGRPQMVSQRESVSP